MSDARTTELLTSALLGSALIHEGASTDPAMTRAKVVRAYRMLADLIERGQAPDVFVAMQEVDDQTAGCSCTCCENGVPVERVDAAPSLDSYGTRDRADGATVTTRITSLQWEQPLPSNELGN